MSEVPQIRASSPDVQDHQKLLARRSEPARAKLNRQQIPEHASLIRAKLERTSSRS
jgi:hypothetical protein